jgi:hypothetical protein
MGHHSKKTVSAAEATLNPGHWLNKVPTIGAVVGIIGIGTAAGLGFDEQHRFFYSYLVAFLFFMSLTLGGLFFTLLHFLTRSGWGIVLRRLAENIASVMPLMAILFIPVFLGMHDLYHWSHVDVVAHDKVLSGKQAYLNPNFFTIRAALFFTIWIGLALMFRKASLAQDENGDHAISRKLMARSAIGMLLFALSLTYGAFDWAMSLDPHWYSTMFGVYFFAGCGVSIYATMSLFTIYLPKWGILGEDILTEEHRHAAGKMLFGFTCFWAYIWFSQFFLIWYADLPEETVWFLHRSGPWFPVSAGLFAFHFALPFVFLMARPMKRNKTTLAIAACWMLMMHYIDLYWVVMPTIDHQPHPSLVDLGAFLGVGGLWVAAVAYRAQRNLLVPINDPRLAESLAFEDKGGG